MKICKVFLITKDALLLYNFIKALFIEEIYKQEKRIINRRWSVYTNDKNN